MYLKVPKEIALAIYYRLKNSNLSTTETVRLVANGCAGQNKNTIDRGSAKRQEICVFRVVEHSYIPPVFDIPVCMFAKIEKI